MTINILTEDTILHIIQHCDIKANILLIISCKFFFEFKKLFLNNYQFDNGYYQKNGYKAINSLSTFFKILFKSNCTYYPLTTITNNKYCKVIYDNTFKIQSYTHSICEDARKRKLIKKDIITMFTKRIKQEYHYGVSHTANELFLDIMKHNCNMFNFDVIDFNIYNLFQVIYHLENMNYHSLYMTMDDMSIYLMPYDQKYDTKVLRQEYERTLKFFLELINNLIPNNSILHICITYMLYNYIWNCQFTYGQKLCCERYHTFIYCILDNGDDLINNIMSFDDIPNEMKIDMKMKIWSVSWNIVSLLEA